VNKRCGPQPHAASLADNLKPARSPFAVALRRRFWSRLMSCLPWCGSSSNPDTSRSGLIGCLCGAQWCGEPTLNPAGQDCPAKHSAFKRTYEARLHPYHREILPQILNEKPPPNIFSWQRQATPLVFIRRPSPAKDRANARRFLRDPRTCHAPLRIRTILTDNGKAFTE